MFYGFCLPKPKKHGPLAEENWETTLMLTRSLRPVAARQQVCRAVATIEAASLAQGALVGRGGPLARQRANGMVVFLERSFTHGYRIEVCQSWIWRNRMTRRLLFDARMSASAKARRRWHQLWAINIKRPTYLLSLWRFQQSMWGVVRSYW